MNDFEFGLCFFSIISFVKSLTIKIGTRSNLCHIAHCYLYDFWWPHEVHTSYRWNIYIWAKHFLIWSKQNEIFFDGVVVVACVFEKICDQLPKKQHNSVASSLAIFSLKSTSKKYLLNSFNRATRWSFRFSPLSLSFASNALMSDICVEAYIWMLVWMPVYLFIYFLLFSVSHLSLINLLARLVVGLKKRHNTQQYRNACLFVQHLSILFSLFLYFFDIF